MTRHYTHKINLSHYGGKQFETCDVGLESETMSFAEIKAEVDKAILEIIAQLPEEIKRMHAAIPLPPPPSHAPPLPGPPIHVPGSDPSYRKIDPTLPLIPSLKK